MDEELIPVRILNEFTYCPRLGYLEWVNQEWADNEHTAEGNWVHRRVDRKEGWIPTPEEAEQMPFTRRSVRLSAPSEGLVGVLDVVDIDASEASPVEYKKGRPPKTGEPAYSPEMMQLAAQALLLRANGWTVSRGYFFYAASREKVEVSLTEELLERARAAVLEVRQLVARKVPPPPLVASPKCEGCSLSGICLPDETHLLQSGGDREEVRQLLAPMDNALPLYVQTNGLRVGISGELLMVTEHGTLREELRLLDTSQVCLFGNVAITTPCIRELAARNIPICYFSYGGWFSAITTGLSHKNVELRQAQYRTAFDPERVLQLARRLVHAKIRNSRTLLRRNARDLDPQVLSELKRLALSSEQAKSLETLLGIEGMAARVYFQNLPATFKNRDLLGEGFDFVNRNRRPPRDPVNALLSFLYSLLTKEFTVIANSIGFDPYLGFYHQPRYGKPALALDLMEEFRSVIADSIALTIINNALTAPSDFQRSGGGVQLTYNARRTVTEAFERRMQEKITHPWFAYRLTYRRLIYVHIRLLARHLTGEIAEFPPFLVR